jgi:hypothetical protein
MAYFHGNCSKVCRSDSDYLAYLVPLDVDVTGNITAKICEVWSEFNIFCTFVTMATSVIFAVVCGSFWRVDKIQNGGRCHGNQGAIFFLFIPNFKKLYRRKERRITRTRIIIIIIIIIRNGAKTISLQTLFGRLNKLPILVIFIGQILYLQF